MTKATRKTIQEGLEVILYSDGSLVVQDHRHGIGFELSQTEVSDLLKFLLANVVATIRFHDYEWQAGYGYVPSLATASPGVEK